jgi:hypothetical protein
MRATNKSQTSPELPATAVRWNLEQRRGNQSPNLDHILHYDGTNDRTAIVTLLYDYNARHGARRARYGFRRIVRRSVRAGWRTRPTTNTCSSSLAVPGVPVKRWATGDRSGPRDGSENSSSADRGLLSVEKAIAAQQGESFGAVCMVG